ncbi:alpha/beta hydrolase [Acrocarpospora catenulata]|uniref:alpha/beta hydrolase n=1 Tax=Acrocarpospora catenulata TaxID=2836182 RepID=UPI001BDB1495|nr:alpha/beta hydrolase [Acrocarpospora catenulata]
MLLRRVALTLSLTAATTVTALPAQAGPRFVAAQDREVVFTVEGTRTYGTLHVPAHRAGQRMPAALLLPGSGPTDRNGDQPPALTPRTLAKLATALADDKIITLRFDKYGSGQTGLGAYAGHPETIDFPAFVRQAAAAYTLLLRQPETDRRALLVMGHSEGALTALLLADQVRPRPAGLALLQPQSALREHMPVMSLCDRMDL